MIRCKETLSEHVYKYKNPGKAVLSANVSRAYRGADQWRFDQSCTDQLYHSMSQHSSKQEHVY